MLPSTWSITTPTKTRSSLAELPTRQHYDLRPFGCQNLLIIIRKAFPARGLKVDGWWSEVPTSIMLHAPYRGLLPCTLRYPGLSGDEDGVCVCDG